jgi:hypothetical protein
MASAARPEERRTWSSVVRITLRGACITSSSRRAISRPISSIVGNTPPRLGQRAQRSRGHQVGSGKNRIQPRTPLEEPPHRLFATLLGEVGGLLRSFVERQSHGLEGRAVAEQSISPGRHVLGSADRRDRPTPTRREVRDRRECPADVVDVDVGEEVSLGGTAADHDRNAPGGEPSWKGMDAVEGHEQDAVGVAGRDEPLQAIDVGRRLRRQQDELLVARREHLPDAADESGKEGIAEDQAGRFGDDQGDGVAVTGRERSRCVVGDVAELSSRALNGSSGLGADARVSGEDT